MNESLNYLKDMIPYSKVVKLFSQEENGNVLLLHALF